MWQFFRRRRTSQTSSELSNTGLIEIPGNQTNNLKANLIFVHGLGADLCFTWHWQKPNEPNWKKDNFWPNWLRQELSDYGVWLFGYDAKKFFLEKGQAAPLYDQARLLLGNLLAQKLEKRPLVFITHSLGGLVVKEMLRVAQTNDLPILNQTKGVVFLATPHVGSDLAILAKIISTISLNLLKETVSVEELQAHKAELRNLDEWYRQNAMRLGIATLPFYEMYPTWGVKVVDPDSANPKVGNQEFCTPVQANHISIAKCRTKKDFVYVTIKSFVKNCCENKNREQEPNQSVPRNTEFLNAEDDQKKTTLPCDCLQEEIPAEVKNIESISFKNKYPSCLFLKLEGVPLFKKEISKLDLYLTINFAEDEQVLFGKKVIFGIKNGVLKLNLKNAQIPYQFRKYISPSKVSISEEIIWEIYSTGSEETPKWIFKASDSLRLRGNLLQEKLATMNIINKPCYVEATFVVSDSKDVYLIIPEEILAGDISQNKLAMLRNEIISWLLESKLKPYLSRVELQYD